MIHEIRETVKRNIFSLCFTMLFILLAGCAVPQSLSTQADNINQTILQNESENQEVLQEFTLDNCDGKADATRIEGRSSSIDVTVSAEIAAKIGASAEIVSAEVQAAVGAALKIGGEKSTSIQLTAPPGTHMYFQLVWTGKAQTGVVQNVKNSGIPVAFQTFIPQDVRIKSQVDIGCETPGANQPTVSPPTENSPDQQPTSLPQSNSGWCYGQCWQYDEKTKIMTWIGAVDGSEDIWQGDDLSLARIQDGWVAVFGPMSVPGEIEACILTLNGQSVIDTCDGMQHLYSVNSNQVFQATSTNSEVGGFRWKPAPGYGYRK